MFVIVIYFPRAEPTERRAKPTLTLYTKSPCPLCDELVEELQPFLHQVQLEKVDITRRENVEYLRKYRHDIPVLHFNGSLLCMHRLDAPRLQQELDEYFNQSN